MAAHLVEQLHQDKGVKDNGVVLGGPMDAGGAWHTKQLIPVEDKTIHHSQLEDALTNDVLGDLQPAAYLTHSDTTHNSVGADMLQC